MRDVLVCAEVKNTSLSTQFDYDWSGFTLNERGIYTGYGTSGGTIYDGWKVISIDGLDESAWTIFTAERGVGDGDVITGKRRNSIDVDIVARAFPGLNNSSVSVSAGDKERDAKAFHELMYENTPIMVIYTEGHEVRAGARLMKWKLERPRFGAMPVIKATWRLLQGAYTAITYSTKIKTDNSFEPLKFALSKDGFYFKIFPSASSGWNDMTLNVDLLDDYGNVLDTHVIPIVKTVGGVKKLAGIFDMSSYPLQSTQSYILITPDWYNSSTTSRIYSQYSVKLNNWIDPSWSTLTANSSDDTPKDAMAKVTRIRAYLTGTVSYGTRLVGANTYAGRD